MGFVTSLTAVALMLAYAIPGFIFVKSKFIREESISAFAKVLMYMCQPCLAVYVFIEADFSWRLFANMGIFLGITLAVQMVLLVALALVFRRKSEDVRYRVSTLSGAFGNVAFMGIPLLNALFPGNNEVVVYSVVFFVGMSILGWTLGSYLLTHDKKYVSVKKVFLNPGVLCLVVALPLFFTGYRPPQIVTDAVTLAGKMTTPLCMLVMGMRLATLPVKPMFADPLQYVTIGIKQLLMPLLTMLIVWFLPLDLALRQTFVILAACPVASVVLNFAEMLGEGQQTAANEVLLGTLLSVLTIPLLMLLVV